MNQLVKTLAEDTAIAAGAFAQSTVVPIDNEPTPRLIVESPLPGPLAQGVVGREASFSLANRLTPQGATAADNVGCAPPQIPLLDHQKQNAYKPSLPDSI